MRAVLLMVLVVACKKDAAPPPAVPAKPAELAKPVEAGKAVHRASVEEWFVVVVPKGGDVKAAEAKARARVEKLGGTVKEIGIPQLGPDELGVMRYSNPELTDADVAAILEGKAFSLEVTGEPVVTLRALAPIAHDIATSAHGWVIDVLAGGAYTPAQFVKRLPGDPLDVRNQIYVHTVSGEGELPFTDTMGMTKLGFPELKVSAVPGSYAEPLTVLVNATAQTLLAHPDITVPGTIEVDVGTLPWKWDVDALHKAGGTGRVRWATRLRSDGDSDDEPVIELVPASGDGTEAVTAMIDTCFGKRPDEIKGAKADDPELAAAAQRARTELLALRSHFAKGVPFKERLLVKAPFTEGGKTEWMWVEVVTWNGDAFQGTLANQPEYVTSVREGSPVTIPFVKVADYMHARADGTKAGDYSDEILLRRESSR